MLTSWLSNPPTNEAESILPFAHKPRSSAPPQSRAQPAFDLDPSSVVEVSQPFSLSHERTSSNVVHDTRQAHRCAVQAEECHKKGQVSQSSYSIGGDYMMRDIPVLS